MLKLSINVRDKRLVLTGQVPDTRKAEACEFFTHDWGATFYHAPITEEVLKAAIAFGAELSPVESIKIDLYLEMNGDDEELGTDQNMDLEVGEWGETVGFVVSHPTLGLGRTGTRSGRHIDVRFFSSGEERTLIFENILRALLPVGTVCKVKGRNEDEPPECRILSQIHVGSDQFHKYIVAYDDGYEEELTERQLVPIRVSKPSSPLEALIRFQHSNYSQFKARESFHENSLKLLRHCVGVKSLLSSRIDLRPHQAYVAGTVISDHRQRYLLADEVGLGKTIEAGIVIHDLLVRKPNANILVLCPGALVQQWFTEMYSKFSGVIFRLPELKGSKELAEDSEGQIILSFHSALGQRKSIEEVHWDLVVVDEVHHLIKVESLYELVKNLSLQDSGLLLLSALPAQHREEEYFDLLALLEPERFSKNDQYSRDRFGQLLSKQKEINNRVGIIRERLEQYIEGRPDAKEKTENQLKALAELPFLSEDPLLTDFIAQLPDQKENFEDTVNDLIHHISDTYRVNRRILRNRRSKLLETHQINKTERSCQTTNFVPDYYEVEAMQEVEALLIRSLDSGAPKDILYLLARQLSHALVHPSSLIRALQIGELSTAGDLGDKTSLELLEFSSSKDWDNQLTTLWGEVLQFTERSVLNECALAARKWQQEGHQSNRRLQKTAEELRKKHDANKKEKFVLFAGFPGLASILADELEGLLGRGCLARFHDGLDSDPVGDRELKEREARRFQKDKNVWLLVCDESGGEGRNFQFVDELFHYDLPWQISKIEQRIGRLDRMGRERLDVISNVIVPKYSKEAAWLNCLIDGIGVFRESISGLEFSLRDIENDIAKYFFEDENQDVSSLPPILKARVERERVLATQEHQLDEASFERQRARKYLSVQWTNKEEERLERAFASYFRANTPKGTRQSRSIRFKGIGVHSDGVVEFHPDDLEGIDLELADLNESREGTFIRGIAQEYPGLQFFSVGNDFFDATCFAVANSIPGRSYAIECDPGGVNWKGFEFVFRVCAASDLRFIGNHASFIEHFFSIPKRSVFISVKGEIAEENVASMFRRLRRTFKNKDKEKKWVDLSGRNTKSLSTLHADWPNLITSHAEASKKYIEDKFCSILNQKLDSFEQSIHFEIAMLTSTKPEGWQLEVDSFTKLFQTLKNWKVELDSVGFISIGGGVHET